MLHDESEPIAIEALRALLRSHGISHTKPQVWPSALAHTDLSKRDDYVFVLEDVDVSLFTAWTRARALLPETAMWPFLLDWNEGDTDLHFGQLSAWRTGCDNVDIAQWIKSEQHALREDYPGEHIMEQLLGEWPEDPIFSYEEYARREKFSFETIGGRYGSKVRLGFAPVREGWLLAPWMGFGGWNDCPDPAHHGAMLRHWETTYAAEVVFWGSDTVECWASSPPTTREAALALAWEQYTYCADIVDQGTETVSLLAAGLLNNPRWFFWWD